MDHNGVIEQPLNGHEEVPLTIENGKKKKAPKPPGFANMCCSYCCLFTGLSGFVLLSLFAITLYTQTYFEREWLLDEKFDKKPQTEIDETYNAQALTFGIGAGIELVIGVLSFFWVKAVQKCGKNYKNYKK